MFLEEEEPGTFLGTGGDCSHHWGGGGRCRGVGGHAGSWRQALSSWRGLGRVGGGQAGGARVGVGGQGLVGTRELSFGGNELGWPSTVRWSEWRAKTEGRLGGCGGARWASRARGLLSDERGSEGTGKEGGGGGQRVDVCHEEGALVSKSA